MLYCSSFRSRSPGSSQALRLLSGAQSPDPVIQIAFISAGQWMSSVSCHSGRQWNSSSRGIALERSGKKRGPRV